MGRDPTRKPTSPLISRKPIGTLRLIESRPKPVGELKPLTVNRRPVLRSIPTDSTPPALTRRPVLRFAPPPIGLPAPLRRLDMPLVREGARGIPDEAVINGFGEALFEPVPAQSFAPRQENETLPDPYVDYVRRYTPEGGVALTYKDIDDRFLLKFAKFLLWCLASGLTICFAFKGSPYPMVPPWCVEFACDSAQLAAPIAFNAFGIVAMMIVYGLILRKPRHIYRSVEVRPDKLIVDDVDEFYRDHFETGWPTFQRTETGMKLTGVYGTRFVEFFDIMRFDENDRMPEVFSANLQAAFQQLWSPPAY